MDDAGYGLYLEYAWTATSTLVRVVLATLGYTIYYIAYAIWVVLRHLVRPVVFLVQPVVVLGRFILAVIATPFRLVVKLETIYIYLGVAALVGLIIGAILKYTYGSIAILLRIDETGSGPERRQRSVKEYRDAKRKQRAEYEKSAFATLSTDSLSPTQVSPGHRSMSESGRKGPRGRSLLGETIMEEDSDY